MKYGDLILLIGRILEMRGRDTVRVSEVDQEGWFAKVGFASWIAWATMQLMRRLTFVVGG